MSTRNPDREVKMIPAICTQCGGQVEVASTQRKAVCRFCGTTFFVTEREDISKTQEKTARRRMIWGKNKNRVIWLDITFCLIALCVAMFIFNTRGGTLDASDVITVTHDAGELANSKDPRDYEDVKQILEGEGFVNIELEPLGDLKEGQITRKNSVKEVSINGEKGFKNGDKFPPDARVIIRYHSYP